MSKIGENMRKNKQEKIEFYEGSYTVKDLISPSYINII